MKYLFLLILLPLSLQAMSDEQYQAVNDHMLSGERELAVVVPTYNNSRKDICILNISSILDQDYDNFHVYIINGRSEDDTLQKLQTFTVGSCHSAELCSASLVR